MFITKLLSKRRTIDFLEWIQQDRDVDFLEKETGVWWTASIKRIVNGLATVVFLDNVCVQIRARNVRAQIRAHRDFSVCAQIRAR
jgi:hypothetical protein